MPKMIDELDAEGSSDGANRGRSGTPNHPMADREVPLGPPSTTIAAAVHAWLDGETPEQDVRRSEWSHDISFWKRLDQDLAARRRVTTPAHLQAQIMNAIPQHIPQLITPWWRREFVVTPQNAVVVVATVAALAVAATALLLR